MRMQTLCVVHHEPHGGVEGEALDEVPCSDYKLSKNPSALRCVWATKQVH